MGEEASFRKESEIGLPDRRATRMVNPFRRVGE